jgi:hypothetical protein
MLPVSAHGKEMEVEARTTMPRDLSWAVSMMTTATTHSRIRYHVPKPASTSELPRSRTQFGSIAARRRPE